MEAVEPSSLFVEMSGRRARAIAILMAKLALVAPGTGEELTKEEFEVLRGLSQGNPLSEIGKLVFSTSQRNVKRLYYKPIMKKLGAINMAHAVRLAVEDGILPMPRSQKISDRISLPDGQYEVLELLSLGASKNEVAELLGISPITITSQVNALYESLGVETLEHAVHVAFENGITSWQRTPPKSPGPPTPPINRDAKGRYISNSIVIEAR